MTIRKMKRRLKKAKKGPSTEMASLAVPGSKSARGTPSRWRSSNEKADEVHWSDISGIAAAFPSSASALLEESSTEAASGGQAMTIPIR
ncbi:hypothetical protein Mapa_015785 [Marchantia paleacea]|nr:hypothetical protein Mapa_015785 [Marchantia paleacea]